MKPAREEQLLQAWHAQSQHCAYIGVGPRFIVGPRLITREVINQLSTSLGRNSLCAYTPKRDANRFTILLPLQNFRYFYVRNQVLTRCPVAWICYSNIDCTCLKRTNSYTAPYGEGLAVP